MGSAPRSKGPGDWAGLKRWWFWLPQSLLLYHETSQEFSLQDRLWPAEAFCWIPVDLVRGTEAARNRNSSQWLCAAVGVAVSPSVGPRLVARLGWRGQSRGVVPAQSSALLGRGCGRGVPQPCSVLCSSPVQMRWGSPGLWAASPTSIAVFWHITGLNCPLQARLAHPRASADVPLLGQWLTEEQLSFRGATEPEPSPSYHAVWLVHQF